MIVDVPETGSAGEVHGAGEDSEMRVLVDAALRILARGGMAAITVTGVLEEAGLSTRAFYRQFASRTALVLAVYRDEQRRASAQLRRRLDRASTAGEALDAWIDHQLALGYDAAKLERTSVLAREGAQLRHEFPSEFAQIVDEAVAPLEDVLARGRADGSFPATDPADDARAIHAVVWDLVERRVAGTSTLSRSGAHAHALRFCRPALGATST